MTAETPRADGKVAAPAAQRAWGQRGIGHNRKRAKSVCSRELVYTAKAVKLVFTNRFGSNLPVAG